jgi:anti-sigma regulatory factor (Ser/Thr protein kinase)
MPAVVPCAGKTSADGAERLNLTRRDRMRQAWPLGTILVLGPLPGAVTCARLHARLVSTEWGLDRLSQTVELLVSELVTNSVRISAQMPARPPVRLQMRSDGARLLVLVSDASPLPPIRKDAAPGEESGRGLVLVDELSDRWGWTPHQDGKTCWFLLS